MNKQILTRNECNALRGLAIIGIFLHNYCHWLGPIVKENEYQYFQKNVDALNVALSHPDQNLLMHLLSFFGHYGVPIFLFLSAYGLVVKYERKPDVTVTSHSSTSVIKFKLLLIWDFIRYHYLKLFKMMIVGFVAFTMVDAITPGRFHYQFMDVIAQLFMYNNILPNPDKIIWPGPYWFFGLMLQLYIVYRLLLYRRHWGYTVALIILCEIIQLSCNPEGEALNRWRYSSEHFHGLLFQRWLLQLDICSFSRRLYQYLLRQIAPASFEKHPLFVAQFHIQIPTMDGKHLGSTLCLPSHYP